MESNGWVFYDRIELSSLDWHKVLKALTAAVNVGREISRAWPAREITEMVRGWTQYDKVILFYRLEDGIAEAARDGGVLKVQWDLSQHGTDDIRRPESMRIRAYQLIAERAIGLRVYACSPNEAEVPQMLAAIRTAAGRLINEEGPSD